MPEIHPTAIVDSKAELADDVKIGPFTIVQGDVVIESGTEIDAHALIADGARIGKNCKFHHGAVIGSVPQDLKFGGEKTTLEIGDNTIVREYCDLNRGTEHRERTVVGKNCFLMAYTHVAHDCIIGEQVIIANAVQMAGHVTVEDWVIIGGMVPIHQFVTIGQHCFVGGGYRVTQDIPPYILAADEPLTYKGLNVVGLKRRGFSKEAIRALQQLYRLFYRSGLNKSQALEAIRAEVPELPEVQNVIEFIGKSERGLIR